MLLIRPLGKLTCVAGTGSALSIDDEQALTSSRQQSQSLKVLFPQGDHSKSPKPAASFDQLSRFAASGHVIIEWSHGFEATACLAPQRRRWARRLPSRKDAPRLALPEALFGGFVLVINQSAGEQVDRLTVVGKWQPQRLVA